RSPPPAPMDSISTSTCTLWPFPIAKDRDKPIPRTIPSGRSSHAPRNSHRRRTLGSGKRRLDFVSATISAIEHVAKLQRPAVPIRQANLPEKRRLRHIDPEQGRDIFVWHSCLDRLAHLAGRHVRVADNAFEHRALPELIACDLLPEIERQVIEEHGERKS